MNETITVTTPDGNFAAYLARPAASSAPAIVVCQEIFGINTDMRPNVRRARLPGVHGYLSRSVCASNPG